MLVYERKQAQPSQADAGPASPVKVPEKSDKLEKTKPVASAPMILLDSEVCTVSCSSHAIVMCTSSGPSALFDLIILPLSALRGIVIAAFLYLI